MAMKNIKHYLEMRGVAYPRTHDIGQLIELVTEEDLSIFAEVENMSF